MTSSVRSIALVAAVLTTGLARASSSIVLTDGQVIQGAAVTRQGDNFIVTLESGSKVTFPAALVREIRVEDAPGPPAPPGFVVSGPTTLAGPTELPSQDPKDQLKAFGPPAAWTQDVINPWWVPTSAYDLSKDVLAGSRATWSKSAVDTTWTPTWAFDPYKDVFAGTRSTWSKNAIDTTWTPKDGWGFKPLWSKPEAPPPASLPPERGEDIVASPSETASPSPWSCGERLLASESGRRPVGLDVHKLANPAYASLGLTLYEAVARSGKSSRRAAFVIAGDECRLVGGDTDALIGLNLGADHAMTQNAASFNAAAARGGGAKIPPGVGKLEYALAFVSLTDPAVSGASRATLRIIAKPDELRSIAATSPTRCALSKGKRRKEERAAASAFFVPKVTAGREGDVATFLTWSSAGGTVYRNTVALGRGGVVSSKRDVVASHVGAHAD